jgi:hypothetical protein
MNTVIDIKLNFVDRLLNWNLLIPLHNKIFLTIERERGEKNEALVIYFIKKNGKNEIS